MSAYSELYLSDAKRHLGDMFDYALGYCDLVPDFFSSVFASSSLASAFERGNPFVVAGMSGLELAERTLEGIIPEAPSLLQSAGDGRTPFYWAGWILAECQWASGKSFSSIFRAVPLSEILGLYPLYHEMDTSRFLEWMEERLKGQKETNLRKLRLSAHLSQAQLAKASGINLRNIQMYEQRQNSIDKAQGTILLRLSRALGCGIEDLLEGPF